MRESIELRMRRWWRRPLCHKLLSLQFHVLKRIERIVSVFIRILALLDCETFRNARFEALAARTDIVLADKAEKYLVFTKDKTISKVVYSKGAFDFEKLEQAIKLLGPTFSLNTLIDVGANIGIICIPAVNRGYARRAVAIEPEPGNFRLLAMNVQLNGLQEKIVLHNLALGPENGKVLEMELSSDNSGDHRIRVSAADGLYDEGARQVIQIKSETFDSILGSLDRQTTLVWVDTQGYEGQILLGANNMIAERVPLVLEFWPYGMRRAGSYPALRSAALRYENFFDLSERQPARRPTLELDALYAKLEETGDYTDILLV